MVSPLDKTGTDIQHESDFETFSRASASGDRVTYGTYGTFGGQIGSEGGSLHSQYLSQRGPQGWTTRGLNPPLDVVPTIGNSARFETASEDLTGVVFAGMTRLTPGSQAPWNSYLRDTSTLGYQLLTDPTINLPLTPEHQNPLFAQVNSEGVFNASSADFSHILFQDRRQLTADAPPEDSNQLNLYQWVDGELELASVLPDESPALGLSAAGGGSAPTSLQHTGDYSISADGTRFFFTHLVSSQPQLYMREGDTTIEVGASEGPDPTGLAIFQLASADGRYAFFTSSLKLTSNSTAGSGVLDLYRWDSEAPIGSRLTDLTVGDPSGGGVGEPNSFSSDGPGVVGASSDASMVYFVASGNLATGAVPGEPNLYLWQEGAGLRHVATLDGSNADPDPMSPIFVADQAVWGADRFWGPLKALAIGYQGPQSHGGARVSSDGSKVLFVSRAQLTGYDTNEHWQVYLYDADADEITCVSCNPRASQSTGNATVMSHFSPGKAARLEAWFKTRNLSSDGTRVFFDSEEALVAEDTNGRVDVYQWSKGSVHLLSGGESDRDSFFLDASAFGDDVFFTTAQRLVDGDLDQDVDVYVASVNGGFGTEPLPPACEGDACLSPPIVPNDPTPASSSLAAPGDPKPQKARGRKCRKGQGRVSRKCVKRKPATRGGTTRGAHR